jgi:hypothetical protein
MGPFNLGSTFTIHAWIVGSFNVWNVYLRLINVGAHHWLLWATNSQKVTQSMTSQHYHMEINIFVFAKLPIIIFIEWQDHQCS